MSGALHIGDDDQWVTLGSAPGLGFGTQGVTIEMWVRVEEIKPDNIHLLGSPNITYFDSFNLGVGTEGKPFVVHESKLLTAREPVVAGNWFHLAYRYEGDGDGPNNGQLLINGIVDVSLDFNIDGLVKDDLFLGPGPVKNASVSGGFDITELRFWPGARSVGKIREQMFNRWDNQDKGIAAYWPLDSEHQFKSPRGPRSVKPSAEFEFIENDPAALSLSRDVISQGLFKGQSSVTLDNNHDHIGLNTFTVEAWVFGDQHPDQIFMSPVLSQHGVGTGWELRAAAGMAEFMVTINGEHQTIRWTADPVPPGWFHVAGVFQTFPFPFATPRLALLRLVVNGITVKSLNIYGDISHYEKPITIGRNRDWPARAFKGALAEVRIWKSARTDAELCSNLFVRVAGDEPGLVAALPLNDWPSGSVSDLVSKNSFSADTLLAGILPAPPLENISSPGTAVVSETEQLERVRAERNELLQEVERANHRLDEMRELVETGRRAELEVAALRAQLEELEQTQTDEATGDDLDDLPEGETTLQSLIGQTRAQIEAARVKVNTGGGVYRLRDVTMDLRIIPAAGGQTVIIPSLKELGELSGGELSHLRLDFSSTDIGQAEPVLVKVPDVIGYTQVLARRKLSEVGLHAEVMLEALTEENRSDERRVVDQLPKANDNVAPQTAVTIFVGRLAPASTSTG